jgi:hypothetical protein
MLEITVGAEEIYDEATETFGARGGVTLRLEHSLVSLSKWEAIHEKPFLDGKAKTAEELLSYVECMLLDENPPGEILQQLSEENVQTINAYIEKKMTATWFSAVQPEARSQETPTAELIYYWMTLYNIDWEARFWHLNQLFTLIRICGLKQSKPKKMNRADAAKRQRELNERRKREMGTSG